MRKTGWKHGPSGGMETGGKTKEFCEDLDREDGKGNVLSSHIYPENPEETQVIIGSMNMGYDIYPKLHTHPVF